MFKGVCSSMLIWRACLLASAFVSLVPYRTLAVPPTQQPPASETPIAESDAAAPKPAAADDAKSSDIKRLQQAIDEDKKRLSDLQTSMKLKVEREFNNAKQELDQTETTQQDLRAKLETAEAESDAEMVVHLQQELRTTENSLRLARERLQLVQAEMHSTDEKIRILQEKTANAEHSLKRLLAKAAEAAAPPSEPKPTSTPDSTSEASSDSAQQTGESPTPLLPGLPLLEDALHKPAASASSRPKLDEARAVVEARAEQAKSAAERFQAFAERLRLLDEEIAHERDLLETARKQVDNADATLIELQQEYQNKALNRATPEELQPLLTKIDEVDKRHRQARLESREHGDQLTELVVDRSELLSEYNLAAFQARLTKEQLAQAEQRVRRMENPFSLENLTDWAVHHGLKILLIFLGMAIFQRFSKGVSRRLIGILNLGTVRGTTEEREHRIRTLVSVMQNALSIGLVGGGTLMIFQELGVPVGPLLGGAAVLGLAVAFGAQNLIRDYFYGFVILLENQYKLNDVIKIRNISGQVEQITLRMTVLRDLEGSVHFIPNGEITSVTNMTHGWSRALFEIRVAFREDVDRVMNVLATLGKEIRRDPAFGPLILEDLTMLGVDAIGESAVVLKFFIKTRPLQQWTVRREMLRRIKKRFDDEGIVIPFPHHTVYHMHDPMADAVPGPSGLIDSAMSFEGHALPRN